MWHSPRSGSEKWLSQVMILSGRAKVAMMVTDPKGKVAKAVVVKVAVEKVIGREATAMVARAKQKVVEEAATVATTGVPDFKMYISKKELHSSLLACLSALVVQNFQSSTNPRHGLILVISRPSKTAHIITHDHTWFFHDQYVASVSSRSGTLDPFAVCSFPWDWGRRQLAIACCSIPSADCLASPATGAGHWNPRSQRGEKFKKAALSCNCLHQLSISEPCKQTSRPRQMESARLFFFLRRCQRGMSCGWTFGLAQKP